MPDIFGLLSDLPGFGFLGGASLPPLNARAGNADSFNQKWGPAIQAFQQRGIPRSAWGPVLDIDLKRHAQGQPLLGNQDTWNAIRSAQTLEPTVAPQEPSFLERVSSDIRDVVSGVVGLPSALFEEAQQLPEAPGVVSEALSKGDVGAALQAPGVRLIPGTYVASSVLHGENPFAEHPVMSVLDLLPAASKVVGKVPSVAGEIAEREALAARGGPYTVGERFDLRRGTRPLRVGARQVKEGLGDLLEARTGSRPKNWTRRALVGEEAGNIAEIASVQARTHGLALQDLDQRIEELRAANPIDPEREPFIYENARLGDHDGRFSGVASTPEEIQAVTNIIKGRDELLRPLQGENLYEVEGEFYGRRDKSAKRVRSLVPRLQRASEIVSSTRDLYDRSAWAQGRAMHEATLAMRGFMTNAQFEEVLGLPKVQAELVKAGVDWTDPAQAGRAGDIAMTSRVFHDAVMERVATEWHGPQIIAGAAEAVAQVEAVRDAGLITKQVANQITRNIRSYWSQLDESAKWGLAARNSATALDRLVSLPVADTRWDVAIDRVRHAADLFESLAKYRTEAVGSKYSIMKYAKNLEEHQAKIDKWTTTKGQLQEALAQARSQAIPQRFIPVVRKLAMEGVDEFTRGLPEETAAKIRQAAEGIGGVKALATEDELARLGQDLETIVEGLDDKVRKQYFDDARAIWPVLKEAGLDPQFLHAVDPSQARQRFDAIAPRPIMAETATQFKKSVLDPKQVVPNFEISMRHQARELVQDALDTEVRAQIREYTGRSMDDLMPDVEDRAQRMIATGKAAPGATVGQIADQILGDEYDIWTPSGVVPLKRGRVFQRVRGMKTVGEERVPVTDNRVLIPKWVSRAMERMYPMPKDGIAGLSEKATNVFRTSILPFSPRWHVNNLVSGAVMLMARTGPEVLRYFDQARKMAKGEIPFDAAIAHGAGSVQAADAVWSRATGQQQSILAYNSYVDQARQLGTKVKDAAAWAYEKGEYIDKMWRSMAYLYAQDKALLKGMSTDAARLEGVNLANTILQDWNRMTPYERQAIRSVVPFYGWAKHILRYTFTMPLDHPTRTAIIGNLARAEWDDQASGVPERWRQFFSIGDTDEWGNVTAVNLRGTNPFSDVANFMTLGGFVGQLNPTIQGVLETMGINTASGLPNQYQPTKYDPVTGKIKPQAGNLLTNLAYNIAPPLELLSVVGLGSRDLADLRISNPDAYRDRIFSTLGVPFMPKEINIHREAALAEIARSEQLKSVLAEARKSGDWSEAVRYPSLRNLYYALKAHEAQLQPFVRQQPQTIAG